MSKVAKLTPQQEARVHALIRRHRYANVDLVHAKLASMGVEWSDRRSIAPSGGCGAAMPPTCW